MRFPFLLFIGILSVGTLLNHDLCCDIASKNEALAGSGQTFVVASPHTATTVLTVNASVDPACDTGTSLQRQALYSQDQEGDLSHDTSCKKFRMVMPVVQSYERETCTLLPSLWWEMVRGWRGRCRGQSDLRTMAPEPAQENCTLRWPSATKIPTSQQRQGTRRTHAQSQTQAEPAPQGQTHGSESVSGRCTANAATCTPRCGFWSHIMDESPPDATSSESGSQGDINSAWEHQCCCATSTDPTVIGSETVALVFEKGPGETVTRDTGASEASDSQGREERGEGVANGSQGHGQGTQRPPRGIYCQDEPPPPMEDIFVDECRAMADIHDRISAARSIGTTGHSICEGLPGLGQTTTRDIQGSVPVSERCTPIHGSPGPHVRRGHSRRSRGAETSRGFVEPDDLASGVAQGRRGRSCSGECHKEGTTQWSHRCVKPPRWQSLAAFWWARYFVTLEYEYLGRAPICPQTFNMKWNHSILSELDFRTEWHARAAAVRLSFECDTISENHTSWRSWTKIKQQQTSRRVHFEEQFSLLCCDPEKATCSIFQGPHGAVQTFVRQFQRKAFLDDDPLSTTAVLISQNAQHHQDDQSLMQKSVTVHSKPITANEPGVPVWYPLADRGGLPADQAESDQDAASSQADSSNDDFEDGDPPNDPNSPNEFIHPPSEDQDRQSALMYHLDDPPIHAMLFWTDFERLMNEIALHYQIPREELFDSYELNTRPPDIPPGTAPLLVHFVNDFPHGANLVLTLVDIEVHGNECEPHFQTFPDLQRRVLPVPIQLTRDTLLRLAKVLDFCKVEHERCLVEINAVPWHAQNRWPIHAQHGDYIRITIPPPSDGNVGTQEMLNDSHHMPMETFWEQYYVPSSPEHASGSEHSSVSPSLISSEAIKREFGMQIDSDHDEHSQLQTFTDEQVLMQLPSEPTSSSTDTNLIEQTAQIVNSSCLLALNFDDLSHVPFWFRGLNTAFGAHHVVENEDESPVCYYDTWYADCRTPSVTEVSRSLRLDTMQNLWQHDIQHLWRDKIQEGVPIHVAWVIPVPPPQPMSRSGGHLIVYQFPSEQFVPFLTSIHFTALEDHGITIACVVDSPHLPPLSIVQKLNLERVCHGRKCTLHRGAIGYTWTMPILVGEGLSLFIPPYHAHAHLDSLSRPKSVELVQTGPAPDAFDISMRLEDHPEYIRALHEIWTNRARRGPADMERILEITTWYLDAQVHPFNDQSRSVILGEDFFQWEQQIREKWADFADASEDIMLVIVRPTPPGWPIDHVHVLALQQFESDASERGCLVTTYDNAANHGAPFTTATVLPRDVNKQRILDAVGRQVWPDQQCSAWFEGFEIRDSSVFQTEHGLCFSVHIYRHQLQDWDSPLPEDEDVAQLQLNAAIHKTIAMSDTAHAIERTKRKTAIGIVPALSLLGDEPSLPAFLEVDDPFGSAEVEQELRHFGLHVKAFIIDHKTAALCCPQQPFASDDFGRIVFVNTGQHAKQRYHVHFPQKGFAGDDIQLMQKLHAAGFAKAVILRKFWHQSDIVEVHFTSPEGSMEAPEISTRVQRGWPVRQEKLDERPMFQMQLEEISQCSLELGVTPTEIQHFFTRVQWPLCDITQDLELPDCSLTACRTLEKIEYFDRLIIYTDGSSHSGRLHRSTTFIDATEIPDSWSFLVLGEKYGPDQCSSLGLVGWMSHQVRYDPNCSAFLGARSVNPLIAEREALTWAFLWRIFLNSNKPTTFRTDSATTKGQAEGTIGTAECDLSFQMLRGCYHLLEAALPEGALQISHVYGHMNEPWNEFVDHVAKKEAHASYYLSWPDIDLTPWKPLIPHLWLIFAKQQGAPAFCGNSFDVPPPALPSPAKPQDRSVLETPQSSKIEFTLSLATANVQSLGRSAEGFAGKTSYLRQQFALFNLNFLGIQEARSEEGASQVGDVLRLCSGASKNNLGVELWCNLACPLGWVDGTPFFLQRTDANVAHKDERRLLVHFQLAAMPFWVLVLHAPQSGQTLAIREAWWNMTKDILDHILRPQEPLFVCIDANAAPGPIDHKHVFAAGFETSSSTRFLRDFLDKFDLCLPATSTKHVGERETWTTPDGHSRHMIDFVCIPTDLFDPVTHSCLLDNFDLGTQNIDHTATALEMRWKKISTLQCQRPKSKSLASFDRSKIAHANLHSSLQHHTVKPWTCSVDEHFEDLQEHFLQCLTRCCPREKLLRKKPYLTDELWQCRQSKLDTRKKLKEAKKLLTRETLARIFQAWRQQDQPTESVVMDLSFNFGTTLRCCLVKLTAKFMTLSSQLTKTLRQSKANHLRLKLEQLPTEASAGQIQQVLKPFIGPSSKLRQGMPPLPTIRNQQGELCHRRQDTVDRWVEHFAAIEGGERITMEKLHSNWVQSLTAASANQCTLDIHEIPTRVELEFALRQMKDGKASGPDGIPSELCRHFPGPIAAQIYTLLLKAAIQGHEPLLLKGGIALPIWKGKKAKDTCTAYRSILLSSNIGKAVHKTMRSKQTQVYEAFLAHQQIGGRKRVPVVLGSHLVKAFLRVHQSQLHATAVLFVDLEAAFYQVVRPLALAGEWSDEILAAMAQRLRMPADTIHALHQHLKQPSAIELAGLSHFSQRAIRAFHSDTFFQVPAQEDCVQTHLGTRPGDAYADIVFGYLMAKILRQFSTRLEGQEVLSQIPTQTQPAWFHPHDASSTLTDHPTEFIGPTWMDDLALCLWGSSNAALAEKIGHATSTLLDLMREHAMCPNLAKGKTELMFTPKGTGTNAWKKKLHGPLATGFYPIIGEAETYQVPIVRSYVHLGSIVHHSGSNKQEAKRRIAIANSCFNKHRKMIFQNPTLPLRKRV